MSFLSKDNSDLLYDVIKETINIDYLSFNQRFLEFGQSNGNKMPLIEMNKQFIRSFLSPSSNSNSNANEKPQTSSNMSTNILFRPQGSRSKNVSFDEQLELHKQHFQQFSAPPPPTPPVFKDEDKESFSNLDLLMQKALSERNYDPIPIASQQPARKLQIGSVIEDEIYMDDVIDVDKFNNTVENKIKGQTTNVPSVTTFFSKLQQIPESPESPEKKEKEKEKEKDSENNILLTKYESMNKIIERLTESVDKLEREVEQIKNTISTSVSKKNEVDVSHSPI